MKKIYFTVIEEIGGIVREKQIMSDDIEFKELFRDIVFDYLTILSPTKKWKIEIDDNGILNTSEVI